MSVTAAQRAAVQTWLQAAWTKIQARQATYLANRGTYRQYKGSHVIPPTAGTTVLPDNLSDHPTNETDGQTLAVANGGLGWPCQVTCNVYESPGGQGYEAIARVTGSVGEVWRIARQVGPETWREHGWVQEVEL